MTRTIRGMREAALSILTAKRQDEMYLPIDYAIDTDLREVLGLPLRPDGQLPYVGWMVGQPAKSNKPSKTSDKGLALIKRYEGLRTNAYLCPANVWTIGYGHTKGVSQGMMISHKDADKLLEQDLRYFESAVSSAVTVEITQNQFDALVSFAFNVGVGAFKKSSLLSLLNRKHYISAAEQFLRWTRGGGRILPGLVKRRREEYELFLS